MLEITIPEQHYSDIWDENKNVFLPPIHIKETKIQIEHSLMALTKWEQKWHKPFITKNEKDEKTYEELKDYIRCMTITHNVDPLVYDWIPKNVIEEVIDYMKDPRTATTIKQRNMVDKQKNTREGITAEIIYYWMISLGIPIEFQKWHLNQLLTLIKVISIKNGKNEKVDKKTAAIERQRMNMERRAQYGSKG